MNERGTSHVVRTDDAVQTHEFIYAQKVNFPADQRAADGLFLQHEYASYFTLQQALGELKDSGLIHAESTHSTTRYEITKEGEETLNFFENNISPPSSRTWTPT